MKAKEILDSKIHGFMTRDILESLLLPLRIHNPTHSIRIEDIELNEESLKLMRDFAKGLWEKMNMVPSIFYTLVSKSPIPYKVVPRWLRDRLLSMSIKEKNLDLDIINKIGLENVRLKFLESIGLRFNSGKNICIITHDIDSEKGLKRALRLKEIEEKYDIESTWFIPTEEYKLDEKIVKRLAENGEIASHGTKHNGKLFCPEDLRKSKEKLEEITEKEIHGFRAPLLQYDGKLLEAIGEARFKYDSSVLTWEPMHPSTMKPDGIELINPIIINGMLEIPVTLPQDHQMLHVLGLTPKQTVKLWTEMIEYIYKMGGISVILVHPDYELASNENVVLYESLLKNLTEMKCCSLKILSSHWSLLGIPLGSFSAYLESAKYSGQTD